jgi:hypothetical protein
METKKKWWQSKIVLLGIATGAIALGNLATGFLSGQGVSPEQMNVLYDTQPAVAQAVAKLQSGENVISAVAGLFGPLIAVARIWFTSKAIG